MSIQFSTDRWEKIRADAAAWWAGELDRPLMQVRVYGCDPGRLEPPTPGVGFDAEYPFSVSAEAVVDRWDWELSTVRYFGDAFPAVWPNFGPGVAAAFMGAELETSEHTVWFHPSQPQEVGDLRFDYDPLNPWLARVKDLCRAAAERWEGLVQVGMTDLGGGLDLLASFRPGEGLLVDLYDHPEEVKQRTWELHELWWRYFDEINAILRPANPAYTAWTPIFSETPYYMLQCDFAYMIGPEMFDVFVRPELAASCERLGHGFYHLDGTGQLAHLDSLLSIPDMKGIQWVPGAGAPGCDQWPEVYRKIRSAGKLIQLFGDIHLLDTVVEQVGGPEGILLIGSAASEDEAREWVKKYGAEA